MFPLRYFAARYFAPRYFAEAGASPPPNVWVKRSISAATWTKQTVSPATWTKIEPT